MGAGEVAALAGREEWRPRFAIGVGGGESEVRDKENTSEFRGEKQHGRREQGTEKGRQEAYEKGGDPAG